MDLNQANLISDAWKEADIALNAPFDSVGDLAIDASGLLYFSQGSKLSRFDMKTLSGYADIRTDLDSYYNALITAGGTGLFGLTTILPDNIVSLNTGDGTIIGSAYTSPARTFIDAASAQQRVAVTPAGGVNYASAAGRNIIYSINLLTGSLRPVTASCPSVPKALALDNDHGVVYYTETTGSDANIGLYAYDLGAQRHTYIGNLAGAGSRLRHYGFAP